MSIHKNNFIQAGRDPNAPVPESQAEYLEATPAKLQETEAPNSPRQICAQWSEKIQGEALELEFSEDADALIKTEHKACRGTLWVVATPLGNPGDLSPRARAILEQVDCVLAEDTRRAGLLFAACGIKAKRLFSFHDHNEAAKSTPLLAELQSGKSLALVSDAGTPLLSDPGYKLVRACRSQGLRVSPVPGPSALLAALSASGLPPQPFLFLGFPPRKEGERRKFFGPYAALSATTVFFERKDRLKDTLRLLHSLYGEREACIARELTKTYEEFINIRLSGADSLPEELLGEITVLIGPPLETPGSRLSEEAVLELLEDERALMREENPEGRVKPRELARRAQPRSGGWSVDELYRLLSSRK